MFHSVARDVLERPGQPYSEHPPRFAYSLTRKGRELGPALDALATRAAARTATR